MSDISYDVLWKETLKAIEDSNYFEDHIFHTYIEKTTLFKIENDVAYISYYTLITYNIMSALKEKEIFESTLSEIFGSPLTIQFLSYKEKEKLMPEVIVQERTQKLLNAKFNPDYTFENFIEGNSNAEAYAACLACCTQNQRLFNPIMLYGNSGLGKTHLLHAIGNYLKKEKPEAKVFYAYSGELVDILIDAMKSKNVHGNTVNQIKSQLIDNDYFLIDDIQNLKNNASQEVFFSVYNTLIERNAQIVITSDIHPNELSEVSTLPTRLISRFTAGLSVNISKPEFNTSIAILKKKLEGYEDICPVTEEVFDYLANKFSNDVRNLEGSLSKLIFNSTIERPDVIDLEYAQRILSDIPIVMPNDELTLKKIKKAVVHFYGLAYKDIEGKSRQKNIMNARHVFVYLSRELLHKPYVAIGQELGNRDHTTISSSYDRACQLIQKDTVFQMAVQKVKDILNKE